MFRFCLFLIVYVISFIFIFTFDRWTEVFFLKLWLAPVIPKLNASEITKSGQFINFPQNFSFGVASSAYQVEGGVNESGKIASIWDSFTSIPKKIADGKNGDFGPDSYHLYESDIAALEHVGFQHYRFSISWTRILNERLQVNPEGLEYYHKVIDALIAKNIEPVVTMFHFDLPQYLDDLGGTTNPIFVDHFLHYADVVFEAFGAKIKRWITINEPYIFCTNIYDLGEWQPPSNPGFSVYHCGHNLLKAHAAAFNLYQDKYFKKFGGKVGITIETTFFYPKDDSVAEEDRDRIMQYRFGWFANPIFGSGGYPQVMVKEIAKRSKIEGQPFSRLPKMSHEMKKSLKGSADFLGLNYYTSFLMSINRTRRHPWEEPSWYKDAKLIESADPTWKKGKTEWMYSVPHGLRDLLNWIKKEYSNPTVLITENGWNDEGVMEDNDRIDYLGKHLLAVAKAVEEDGCNVIGHSVWSLLDSFEWKHGFTVKFGLFSVNYQSPGRERSPRKSAEYLRKIIQERKISLGSPLEEIDAENFY